MNRVEFRQHLSERVMVLDGATGTELQKRGMPAGICPEQWVIENPGVLIEIQREYVNSGSNAVYAYSFGANRIKLKEYGLADKVFEINRQLARISKEAVGDQAYVAGDLSPTGQFIKPYGELEFEEVVQAYKEQVKGLLEGGVDFFVIETMMDIQEARAAVIAVKESCDLPVCVSMTFGEEGRTMMGTPAEAALITLQSLGVDAVGCNCSTGPQSMLKLINSVKDKALVPLLAKPNAGLPKLVEGKTIFDMAPEEFGSYIKSFVEAGVNLLGGCCGTSPAYIEQIKAQVAGNRPAGQLHLVPAAISTGRKVLELNAEAPAVLGCRIDTGIHPELKAEIGQGITDLICDLAMEQMDDGADVINVRISCEDAVNDELLVSAIETLVSVAALPLSFDISDSKSLERVLRVYPGRALVNCSTWDIEELKSVLPAVVKYGPVLAVSAGQESAVSNLCGEYYKTGQSGRLAIVVMGKDITLLDA